MNRKEYVQDFTVGSIPLKLLRFSVPFMLSNAMQVLYSLVDMLVVGQLVGSAGLSAVTIGSNIFNLMAMLALGFCNGGQIYIAQLLGAKQSERLGHTIGTLFAVMLGLGAVMATLGLTLGPALLRLMNTPEEAFAMARSYVLVCSGGVLFTYGYNMVSAVLRGMGDSRHPFVFIAIASVLNIVLDLLFVGPLQMGAAGAALATITGQAVSFIYALVFLFRHRAQFSFPSAPGAYSPDRLSLRMLIHLGIPLTISSSAINFSMLVVTSMVNRLGVAATAALGVGLKLDGIASLVTQGVSMGVSSMVGQNFAAGKFKRVRQIVCSSWAISGIVFFLFSICFLLYPREMFGFFTDDTAVIELAPVFISAMIWSFPAFAIMRGPQGFVQGIGFTSLSMVTSVLDGLVMRISLSWLFGLKLGMGIWGFFFGYGMATYATAIPALVYFLFGKWTRRAPLTLRKNDT